MKAGNQMRISISILMLAAAVCLVAHCAGSGRRIDAVKQDDPREVRPDDETRAECLKAIKRARLDARSGMYRMYVYGRDRYDAGFARYLGEYMKTRYGIELIVYGPEDRERKKCYSNEMDKIILNTFGADILANAEQEAREMFDSRK
jgi:hypothetical protein